MIRTTGIRLRISIGASAALPVPAEVVRALQSVEISYGAAGAMNFGATFEVGRGSLRELTNYDLLKLPLFRPFNRVRMVLDVGARPTVLMDGMITNVQLNPSNQPGASTLTVIGEDASVMMSLEERAMVHPALNDSDIVSKILVAYTRFGLRPQVSPAVIKKPPVRTGRCAVQLGSDLAFVRQLATRNGYVFQIVPDPAGGGPSAYWGPPKRLNVPQPALSIALGAGTNVDKLDFEFDALAPFRVEGSVQDPLTGSVLPISVRTGTDVPTTRQPVWASLGGNIRLARFVNSGVSTSMALSQATARSTASARHAVSAAGELDTLRYGHVLVPYQPIGVRGAGADYDGTYFVSSVTHLIRPGSYRQRFALNREGTGALAPVVRP
jgi:hypothetical protein